MELQVQRGSAGRSPLGHALTCYADNILIMARRKNWDEVRRRAAWAVTVVVAQIRALELEVALLKTEALWFCELRQKPPRFHIVVDGVRVEVGTKMKYLGFVLDSHWRFAEDEHFHDWSPDWRRQSPVWDDCFQSRRGPKIGGAACIWRW